MVKTVLLSASALIAVPAIAASSSIDKIDLSKGEVLLEVQGEGQSMRKVTEFGTSCAISASAETADAAKIALDAKRAKLQKSVSGTKFLPQPAYLDENEWAIEAGEAVAEAAVEASEVDAPVAPPAPVVESVGANSAKSWQTERFSYRQQISISSSSLDSFLQVKTAISENDCDEDYQLRKRPILKLGDEAGGKKAAIARAITSARDKADSYATAMDMKVVRILRVSEVGAVREFLGADVDRIFGLMRDEMFRDYVLADTTPVSAAVTVDFVLAPK